MSAQEQFTYTRYLEWSVLFASIIGILVLSTQLEFVENLKPTTTAGKYVMIAGIIVMGFVALAAHELGHLLIGLKNGFQFELFVVRPFGWKRENGQVKRYWNTDLNYYGGVAATSPVGDSPDNAQKFAQVLLAGSIASVLFAALCFVAAYLIGRPGGVILYAGGMISMAIFFATTIPSRTGSFFTDRKRYQRLMRPGKARAVELAILKIMGQFTKDNSCQNIDKADIQTLISDNTPFLHFYGLFNLVCFELEHYGKVSSNTWQAYNDYTKTMSKQLVKVFEQEVEAVREKVAGDVEREPLS